MLENGRMPEQIPPSQDVPPPEVHTGTDNERTAFFQVLDAGDVMRASQGASPERLADGSLASGGLRLVIVLPEGLRWENGRIVPETDDQQPSRTRKLTSWLTRKSLD